MKPFCVAAFICVAIPARSANGPESAASNPGSFSRLTGRVAGLEAFGGGADWAQASEPCNTIAPASQSATQRQLLLNDILISALVYGHAEYCMIGCRGRPGL